jgi:hypothetical protein
MRTKPTTKENITPRITCTSPWRVAEVTPLPNFTLEATFFDGTHGFVEMAGLIIGNNAGVFAGLKDKTLFNQVYLEHGAVTWPGEIDLAPDAMHHEVKRKGTWSLK